MQQEDGLRLAELVATLSLATDHWGGNHVEQGLRAAVIAARLAEAAGMDEKGARDAYYLAMLRTVGCAGDGDLTTILFGEEAGAWSSHLSNGSRREVIAAVIANVGRGEPRAQRLAKVTRAFLGMRDLMAATELHCETGRRLATSLCVGQRVTCGLEQVFERWDGRGRPLGLKHEALDQAVCVAHLATDTQAMLSAGGLAAALAMVATRRGRAYAPHLVDVLTQRGSTLCDLESAPIWELTLESEPGTPSMLRGEAIDRALAAMGEYADMKSSYFCGHSAGVAALAAAAAERVGMSASEVRDVWRAGQLHDLGRVSVPSEIWDKAEPLTNGEQERIRMHAYVTERILCRAAGLGNAATIASMSHERLDGSGYHRRLPPVALPMSVRVLAAADVYHALREARPHRSALAPDQAAAELRRLATEVKLEPDAVEAVLLVEGHQAKCSARPAGLSKREVEVLQLVAQGMTNKEIAVALDLSAKTVGHHLQHAFKKIGVRTRSAAGVFASRHELPPAVPDAPSAMGQG